MPVLPSVAPDDEITSDAWNDLIDILNGLIDGTYDDLFTLSGGLNVSINSLGTSAIRTTNANAGGTSLIAYAANNTDAVMFTWDGGVNFPQQDKKITIGNNSTIDAGRHMLGVGMVVAADDPQSIAVMINVDHQADDLDDAAIRAVVEQTTGDSSFRAGEFHVVRNTGAGNKSLWGLEVGVHSAVQSASPFADDAHHAINVNANNSLWIDPGAPLVRNDYVLAVGGENGWLGTILSKASDNTTILHRLNDTTTGDFVAGDAMHAGRIFSTGQGATKVGILNHLSALGGQTHFGMNYNDTWLAGVIGAFTQGSSLRPVIVNPLGGGMGVNVNPGAGPAALSATLHVGGTGLFSGALSVGTTVTAGTLVLTGAGAVGAPAWSFTGDPNTGVFNPSADTLAIATGGAERLYVTSGGLLEFRDATNQNAALGAGAAATLGTVGGSGPSGAGQFAWLKVRLAGTNIFLPYWA